MNGDYLLDTSIIIKIFNGEKVIVDKIQSFHNIFIPAVAVGELYYGAYNSSKKDNNLEKIDWFCQSATILNADTQTAKLYGYIKNGLKRIGKPIPENDIWIAAISIQNNLILACRDVHFSYIDGLKFEML